MIIFPKVIDKAMCQGKEHYIDAEIRIMRRLNHPNTVSLIAEQDTPDKMFLILELVRGFYLNISPFYLKKNAISC